MAILTLHRNKKEASSYLQEINHISYYLVHLKMVFLVITMESIIPIRHWQENIRIVGKNNVILMSLVQNIAHRQHNKNQEVLTPY